MSCRIGNAKLRGMPSLACRAATHEGDSLNIPFSVALLFANACLYPCIALAQSFPSKPLRVVTQYVLAAEQVMRAAPNGYSILASNSATHVIRQFLVKNMSFDPAKNFTAITQLTRVRGIVGKPLILKHTLMESSCE